MKLQLPQHWINHYVILALQKLFGIVGKVIIRWPVLFICISLTASFIVAGVGMPILFMNPPMDIEALGASSKPGHAAAMMKQKYFPSQTAVSLVAVTLQENENVFHYLPDFCLLQRKLEDSQLYKDACARDHENFCVEGMFDQALRHIYKKNKTDNADEDCKNFEGGFIATMVPGLGDLVNDLVGFATTGGFKGVSNDAISVLKARQMLVAVAMDAKHPDTKKWENEVFLPILGRLRAKVQAKEGDTTFLQKMESIEYNAGGSMEAETQSVIFQDVPLIGGSFLLMFLYCIVMLVRKWKCPFFTQTRFGLAFLMMLTATLALGIAYGFQGFAGESFSALSLAVAFIIYGVGIDDTFVLVDAYARINRDFPKRKGQTTRDYIEHNIHEAYVETSDAITLTTLTDCVAFFTGASLDVLAMRGFCITAGIAVLSVFVLQSTFFLPCLVLDERRRLGKRYDVFCCIKADHKRKKAKVLHGKSGSTTSLGSAATPFDQVRAMFTAKDRFNFLRFLFNVPTAIGVCCLFVAAGVFNGTYAWTHLNKNLEPTDFLPEDSYVLSFIDTVLKGKQDGYPMFVDYIFETADGKGVDFSNPTHRAEIIKVYEDQMKLNEPGTRYPEEKKLMVLKDSILQPGVIGYLQDQYPLEISAPDTQVNSPRTTVENWLANNPQYQSAFNGTEASYVTRFQLNIASVSDFQQQAIHRTKLQDQADKSLPEGSALRVYVYEMIFSQIDRFIHIDQYFVSTVVSSIIGVFAVNCFFTLPLYAFVSTLCVAFVIAHILIIFPLGGIDYNTLLVMNLVLAIGFAVDYCAHIGQHFANNPHLVPKARALNAINTMAGSVLKAGFSTILAVSCLVFSRGLVTSTLLKCFVVMVIAGLLHALIFMPCTLFLLATASERMFPTKKSDPEIQLESE